MKTQYVQVGNKDISQVTISVGCDQYQLCRNWEDGTPVIGECWYILATRPDGKQWVLRNVGFKNRSRKVATGEYAEYSDDGYEYFFDEQAEEKAEALAEKVRARGVINLDLWEETHPVYGSDYYVRSGEEQNVIAWEARLAEEERWA